MTQFSRSMTIECWGTGVDFYVSTPLYVVSNLYKRKYGTLIAPLPIAVVTGSLAQLGKKYLWQVRRGVLSDVFIYAPVLILEPLMLGSRLLVPWGSWKFLFALLESDGLLPCHHDCV